MERLKVLAEIFNKHNQSLYAVGGFVRAFILRSTATDIDLCGTAHPKSVKKILSDSDFEVNIKSLEMGTLQITDKTSNQVFEYTTFRTERYSSVKKGSYFPIAVKFTKSIKFDCKRRDFTMNAIYLNLLNGEIFDPFDGIKDLQNGIVRALPPICKVLNIDGTRILRMIKFVGRYNYNVDEETLKVAKDNSDNLRFLSQALVQKYIKEIKQTPFSSRAMELFKTIFDGEEKWK